MVRAIRFIQLKLTMKYEFLKFLPLLLLYLFLVLTFSSNTYVGDEAGYINIATDIVHGSYLSDGNLWWGPGYPITLTPFVLFKLPLLTAKLLNPFFLFGAVIYFYKTLNLYLEKNYAVIFTYCFGLYPPFMREIYLLMTESLVFLLVCGFMFHFCKSHQESGKNRRYQILASLYLGYLALTKIFYGYVILAGILLFLMLFIFQKRDWYRKTTFIYFLALAVCIPYLLITYSRTGKIFYWGTSGGLSLYWMSTPYNNEMGDWFSGTSAIQRPELSPHRDFFEYISNLSEVEKDDALKQQALENISQYPLKYISNWVANIGRLWFSYPFSYTPQKLSTFYYLLPNMFIFVLFVLSIYPAIVKYRLFPVELIALLLFDLIAFGGTSLLSAYDRQFRPLVPVILLWLSFIYVRVVKIQIHLGTEIP